MAKKMLPLSYCADEIGVSTEYVRKAITQGVPVNGVLVKLEAERLPGTRPTYRIHRYKFGEFLRAIEWSRVPAEFLPAISPALEASS